MELPMPPASLSVIADAAVTQLLQRGLVDAAFFDRLRSERPGRLADIERVRALFEAPVPVQTPVPVPPKTPINVFISYAQEDEAYRKTLDKSLSLLKRKGLISVWFDRQIQVGQAWKGEVDRQLEAANLILLLVSSDFLASDYCWDVEVQRAMERHREGSAKVVPIFIRACDWTDAPFAELKGVPDPKVPIAEAPSQDVAWTQVVEAIRGLIC